MRILKSHSLLSIVKCNIVDKSKNLIYYRSLVVIKRSITTTLTLRTGSNPESDLERERGRNCIEVSKQGIEEMVENRSSEGENTVEKYRMNPEQKRVFDAMQDEVDQEIDNLINESEDIDPDDLDPESMVRCDEILKEIEKVYDKFIDRVDEFTTELETISEEVSTSPSTSPSSTGSAPLASNSPPATESNLSPGLVSGSPPVLDSPVLDPNLNNAPDQIQPPVSPSNTTVPEGSSDNKRKRENTEELENLNNKRVHTEEVVSSSTGETTRVDSTTNPPSTTYPPSGSLLDDFADPSTEFPDYFGGGDD